MSRMTPASIMILASLVLGACFPLVQYTLRAGYDVSSYQTLRFFVGAAGLGLLTLLLKAPVSGRTIIDGALLGLLIAAAYWLQADGLRFTTSSQSAFVSGLALLFTPLVALSLGNRILTHHAVAAGMAILGLYALVTAPGEAIGGWNRGTTETLASAALFGVQIVMTSYFCRRSDAFSLAFIQVLVAGLLMLLMLYGSPGSLGLPPLAFILRPDLAASVLFTGILAGTFCFWAQCSMQTKLGPTEIAVLFALEPVFATLIAISGIVPGIEERLTLTQWSGAVLLLLAALTAEVGPQFWRAFSRSI
jgi:drug/metabolite transporter (DMT)-like permease